MKLLCFAVFDVAVGAFMRPFWFQSRAQAIRSFSDEVNRSDSEMGKHPKDYQLFYLGNFDEDVGAIEGVKPERIAQAIDFVKEDSRVS